MFWPLNSVKKVKPILPQGRSTTLVDMMQLVSDWFDFEEGENGCCDESGEKVVDCVDSVQEKVVDCLDVDKNVERIKDMEIKGLKVPVDGNVSLENGFDQINTNDEPPVELKPVQAETDSEKKMESVTSTNVQTTQVQPSEQDVDVAAKDIVDNHEKEIAEVEAKSDIEDKQAELEVGRVADVVEHVSSAKVDAGDGDEIQAAKLDVVTWNTVMDAYCRMGLCDEAWKIFKNIKEPSIISWTILISGYSRIGKHEVSLSIFRDMIHCGASADSNSFSSVLVSCRHLGALMCGKEIHSYGVKAESGFGFYSSAGPALLTIYAKHGRIQDAKRLKALGDASSVVHQIVGTLCMGFENVKTKGARRRQWQIAWSFPAFHWTIVLVPLWISDELRRDFSVGVYHSHKSNRGLRFFVVLLVISRVLQPNSRSSSFQRKGD